MRRTSDAPRELAPGDYLLRVTTTDESAARDHSAIDAGIDSFELMLRAGAQSAAVILRDYADRLSHGVAVFAGVGNNGGDAYIVAAQLARAGVRVMVIAAATPRTDDARRADAIAHRGAARGAGDRLTFGVESGAEMLIVDGLLGTGHRGVLRDAIVACASRMNDARLRGATVVALDLPSGMDASTGQCAAGVVPADTTLTYGTLKRGLLLSRAVAGRVLLLDIGLGAHAHRADDAWHAADAQSLADALPTIPWDAHKGRRAHLALIGGATGMAGAIVLATRAALASGIGLARAWVEAPGVPSLQQSVPQAIARGWDSSMQSTGDAPWGHALAIGPGLGRSDASRTVMRAALDRHPGVAVVLDADALTLLALSSTPGTSSIEQTAETLRAWLGSGRATVCTPHPGEFARMTGVTLSDDWEARLRLLREFARASGATIVLKGTPTLIAPSDGAPPIAMPRGSAVLATGGSGDILTGIIGTLLAQGVPPRDAALLGTTAHGLAAEHVARDAGGVRGLTLDDLLAALPGAWRELAAPATFPPGVLAELPAPLGAARRAARPAIGSAAL